MGGSVGCWQDWNDTFPNFPLIKQRHTRNDILLRRQPHPLLILTTSYLQHWTFNRIGWSNKVRGNGYVHTSRNGQTQINAFFHSYVKI